LTTETYAKYPPPKLLVLEVGLRMAIVSRSEGYTKLCESIQISVPIENRTAMPLAEFDLP